MKKIKIGYFADGPWSHKTFEYLIKDDSIEIKFIVPRTDTKDETLKKYSKKHKIDYLKNVQVNSLAFFKTASSYNCDLFISMSFNQIFRSKIINLPPLKIINCHAGKLPFYRGRNVLNWALINDEKEFGITIHYIDVGIDTGDIILQETFPITEKDDYGSLLRVAYLQCGKLLYKAVKKIQKGDYNLIKQKDIHPIGFYCGKRIIGDEIINWHKNSREIFNFVRALSSPGPFAKTFCNGKQLLIKKTKLITNAISYKNIPGQIVGKNDKTLIIKTNDTIIEIIDYEYEGKLNIGQRLSNEK